MKIKVELEVSQETETYYLDTDRLNISEAEWKSLDDVGKNEIIQNYVDDSNHQPYWIVESFKEY